MKGYSQALEPLFNRGFFPYDIQMKGIDWMMKRHYCILGDEPGVGKTIQATAVMALSGGRSICVVPSSLKVNWKNEIEKYCNLKVKIITNGRAASNVCWGEHDVIIVSYSLLGKFRREVLLEADNYIFDEAHYLCNIEAQRTQVTHEIIEKYVPNRVLLLSGTPVKNRVGEYFSLLALCSYNNRGTSGVDISIDYPSLYKFQDTFSWKEEYRIGRRKITKFEGTRNVPLLKTLLRGKYKRRTLDQVAEIPPQQHIDVDVDTKEIDEELYQDFLDGNGHVSTSKAKTALAKAKDTIQYARNLLQTTDAVIIFTDHVASATAIHEGLSGSVLITGSVPTKKRAEYVERFQNGKLDIIVATIGSASVGFTLTRSKDIIFNDLAWVEADNEQARRRIYRVSQTEKTRIHYILGSKMDKMIKKTLARKIANLKEIV